MILLKRSVILILISVFIINTSAIVVYTYASRYLLYLGTGRPLMQLIITIFPLTSFIFPPLYGYFSDKTQKRFIFIVFGTIGMNISYFFLFITQNLILIVIMLFFFGFFMASSSLLLTLFAELVEDDKRLISYINAIIVGGWFVGAQSGGIFIDIYGIEKILFFTFLISLPTILFVAFIREDRALILERYKNRLNDSMKDSIINTTAIEIREEQNLISQSVYHGLFFRNFSVKPILANLAIIMAFHINSDTKIGFLIGINFLLQIFQMLLIGKLISNKNIKSFMIIGYLLSAIAVFGYIISTNFWSYLLFQFLVSFSYSLHWAATITYIAQNTIPKNKGKYIGYANMSVFSGSFAGGILFSLLLLSFNSDYYIAMSFMIIFPIISTVIIFLKFKPGKISMINSKKDIISE